MEEIPVQDKEIWDDLIGDSRENAGYSRAKRLLDLLLSTSVLLLFSPLMLLTVLTIYLEDRGPILYRQTRVGMNGRFFNILKFRSMVPDADMRLHEVSHLNELDGPVFKIRNDPRITGVGRIIRKLSIDELPQLFNVLKGEMSLVGPRPPLPSEVEQYEDWQLRRLSVMPGITCIWQISGRNELNFDDWVRLDLQYIDNQSIWQDFKILLLTLPAVIRGRGAY
ncbi:MAG: exopolysaccharide biosynthesis polyprenyl glycosylphosphotransferase [bacterium]|nr:exopolysaccharide biosynthesis polyprenyl glycosylphosphotransferase [bacterium]